MNIRLPCPDLLRRDIMRLIPELCRVLERHRTKNIRFVVVQNGQKYVLTFRHDGEADTIVDARLN